VAAAPVAPATKANLPINPSTF